MILTQEQMAAIWFPGHSLNATTSPTAMAEAGSLTQIKDQISKFFEGTDLEFKLIVLRYLRMDMPHQSTQLGDLERAIAQERKKKKVQEVKA